MAITQPDPGDPFDSGPTRSTLIIQEIIDAITDITPTVHDAVANQSAMLALSANVGDIAVRTDLTESFILKTAPASTLGNWKQLPSGVPSLSGIADGSVLTAESEVASWEAPTGVLALDPDPPPLIVIGDSTGDDGDRGTIADGGHTHGFIGSAVAGLTIADPSTGVYYCGTAQFAMTLQSIVGYRLGGTGLTVNFAKGTAGSPLNGKSSDVSVTSADDDISGAANQNQSYAAGDMMFVVIASVTGSPTLASVQANFSVP